MSRSTTQEKPAATQVAGTRNRLLNLRTFESLKVRNYRYYMASSLSQMACMNMQMLASGWFMYKLTGSSALLGLTMLAGAIPSLTLSFFGGTIADRVPKKPVLFLGLLASSLIVLWIALSTSLHIITWHYLIVSSFLQGSIMALVMPSWQSIIPEIVGRGNLNNAIALNAAGMNVNQIGAPAIAGFVVAWQGIGSVYYIMAVLYVMAALWVLPIRKAAPANSSLSRKRGVFGDIKDGITYVLHNRTVLTLLLLTFFTMMLAMPFRMLLPVFTEDVLKVGPEKLGVLFSISGIGALVGSLFIASWGSKGRGMIFLHTGLLTGLCIIAFSLSTSYWLSLAIMGIVGLGQAGRMALSSTLIQSHTEDAYLGRVMSLFMMQFGLVSLGVFGASVAAEFVGIQWAIGTTGALLVLVTIYYYAFSQRIRRLD